MALIEQASVLGGAAFYAYVSKVMLLRAAISFVPRPAK